MLARKAGARARLYLHLGSTGTRTVGRTSTDGSSFRISFLLLTRDDAGREADSTTDRLLAHGLIAAIARKASPRLKKESDAFEILLMSALSARLL